MKTMNDKITAISSFYLHL